MLTVDAPEAATLARRKLMDDEAATFGYPRARVFSNSGSKDLWLSATGAVLNGG
jgi:hypothetical protein